MVSVPGSVPRVDVIHVAPRPTEAARISASKVTNISRTLILARSGGGRRATGQRRSKAVGKSGRRCGSRPCGLGRLVDGLGRIIQQLFDAHENIRSTLGENRRRLDL